MNPTEQKLVSLADVLLDTTATVVSAANPAYAGIIALASMLADHITSTVNAGSVPNPQVANDLAAAIPTVVGAVATIHSSAATATAKAEAVGGVATTALSLWNDFVSLFQSKTGVAAPVAAANAQTAANALPVIPAVPTGTAASAAPIPDAKAAAAAAFVAAKAATAAANSGG